MPSADNGMVRRDSMPAAMPSWMAPTSVESVFSSGVSRMPPAPQMAIKKNAVAARKIVSIWSRMNCVARSKARSMAKPTGVPSSTEPAKSPSSDSPTRSSKSRQRTFSSPSGWPATS